MGARGPLNGPDARVLREAWSGSITARKPDLAGGFNLRGRPQTTRDDPRLCGRRHMFVCLRRDGQTSLPRATPRLHAAHGTKTRYTGIGLDVGLSAPSGLDGRRKPALRSVDWLEVNFRPKMWALRIGLYRQTVQAGCPKASWYPRHRGVLARTRRKLLRWAFGRYRVPSAFLAGPVPRECAGAVVQ